MRGYRATAVLVAVLCLAACGKKGAILPPLPRTPQPPEFLSLSQQGAHFVLEWKNPTTYIDGRALPGLARVEVWEAALQAGEAESPTAADFRKRALLLTSVLGDEFVKVREGTSGTFRLLVAFDPSRAIGRSRTFGLRAVDASKKASAYSALKSLAPKPLPLPPSGLQAEVGPGEVTLRWAPAGENIDGSPAAQPAGYRVLRSGKDGPYQLLISPPVMETSFRDGSFEFGRTYRYIVRAATSVEEPFDESDDSPPLVVVPLDVFPPAAPAGLTTLPGEGFISLAWDPNAEPDLAGYRLWRREEGAGEFREVSPSLLTEPAFVDRTVEKSRRYEYAVSAEDKTGNRSPLSASVADIRRSARP